MVRLQVRKTSLRCRNMIGQALRSLAVQEMADSKMHDKTRLNLRATARAAASTEGYMSSFKSMFRRFLAL
jgi:hypothetical protein